MGGDNQRIGNIRDDLSGERLGEAKTHSNGQAGNRETSECGGQADQTVSTFRKRE